MLFSFFNTSVSFQGYIKKILAEKLDIYLIVYLDNILIYIIKANHGDAVWWDFNQLRKYFLYINFKKCSFHQDVVQFLGYEVSVQDVYMENKKIKTIRDCFEP